VPERNINTRDVVDYDTNPRVLILAFAYYYPIFQTYLRIPKYSQAIEIPVRYLYSTLASNYELNHIQNIICNESNDTIRLGVCLLPGVATYSYALATAAIWYRTQAANNGCFNDQARTLNIGPH